MQSSGCPRNQFVSRVSVPRSRVPRGPDELKVSPEIVPLENLP